MSSAASHGYQVIARRYRPRRFDEVVGQEAAAATLRNAILHERLAHAYLFCGPRGVGKTSMARIFARALNCPVAADRSRPKEDWGIPCNECEVCDAVHAGDEIDVLEMDGASHRGIEDIREIIDNVRFAPSRGDYKIYIIDEVHMLTREAFNALLKVLEEPPSHVKFIFATTEAHKIPDTVLSRCQRFDFHPIGEPDIVRRLEQICQLEGVEPETGLLETIARHGRGGLRDAQTLLDQLISFSEGTLLTEDLDRITGRVSDERLEEIVSALGESRPGDVLTALSACFQGGTDPAVLVEQIVERYRRLLGEAVAGSGSPRAPEADPSVDRIVGALQILHDTAARLKGSPFPDLALEISLVKLARLEEPRSLDEAIALLRDIRQTGAQAPRAPAAARRGGDSSPAPAPTRSPAPAAVPLPAVPSSAGAGAGVPARASESARVSEPARVAKSEPPPAITEPAPQAAPDFARLRSLWDQILIEFRERSPELHGFVNGARICEGASGTIHIYFRSAFHLKQMGEPRRIELIQALVREVTGAEWRVKAELDREKTPEARPDAPSGGVEAKLRDSAMVKKARDLFRGKIV